MNRRNGIKVHRFHFPDIEEVNSFLVICPTSRRALLVDAGGDPAADLDDILKSQDLSLEYIFITHAHYDHTGATEAILARYPEAVLLSAAKVRQKRARPVSDGEQFILGELKGRVHLVPGHTADGAALYLAGHLFTGDILFAGSVGGTGDRDDYHAQIQGIKQKLLVYPDDTAIHPGHGPDSLIGLERIFNPFL